MPKLTTRQLQDPVKFDRGPAMKNRIALAPLTNLQSHPDGTASDLDARWLEMRARGGFGMVMTCAAYVQDEGKGYSGQLGVSADTHLPGLERLSSLISQEGAVSALQLMHAGSRVDDMVLQSQRTGPFADAKSDTRALTTGEVEGVVEAFVRSSMLAEKSGFNGIELHGAHGYLLCAFLNAERNHRDDRYGGTFENRSRIFFEIVRQIRSNTGSDFQIGVRLSPDRYGIPLPEAQTLASQLMATGEVEYVDMSLWDVFGTPSQPQYSGSHLIDHFSGIERSEARFAVAGKIPDAPTAIACVSKGADMVMIGRAAILQHDFANRALKDGRYQGVELPVTRQHLQQQGVGEPFIHYLASNWKSFVAD